MAESSRVARIVMVGALAACVSYCETPDEGSAALDACNHVATAKRELQTFLQNHPVGGGLDSPSQAVLLGNMVSELNAGVVAGDGPPKELVDALEAAINDAGQMQSAINSGKPVTTAALISDFDNLASICGEFSNSALAP